MTHKVKIFKYRDDKFSEFTNVKNTTITYMAIWFQIHLILNLMFFHTIMDLSSNIQEVI